MKKPGFKQYLRIVANFKIVAQELRQNNSGSKEYKFNLNETISKLQGALRETNTKIQLVVAMIGTAPVNADSNSSVWEWMGQLKSKLGEVKEQVEDGFKEMEDLHRMEKVTSKEMIDLTVSFDNLANSYWKTFRAIKEKLISLEQGRQVAEPSGYEGTGRRGIRWSNSTLDASLDAGTYPGQNLGVGARFG
jgi:seryl-tRNA synthetase